MISIMNASITRSIADELTEIVIATDEPIIEKRLEDAFIKRTNGHNVSFEDIFAGFLVNFEIKRVIFNEPATIVFWEDGTKTVVKANGGDKFDKEKGLAMAICKKSFGNKGNFNNIFKKYLG